MGFISKKIIFDLQRHQNKLSLDLAELIKRIFESKQKKLSFIAFNIKKISLKIKSQKTSISSTTAGS